jgi:hypothetical protein
VATKVACEFESGHRGAAVVSFRSIGLIVQQEDANSARWPVFSVDSASATPGESSAKSSMLIVHIDEG